MTVHQFLPTWEPGAVGAHALGVARALEAAGIECATWADDVRPGLDPIARPADEFFASRATGRGARDVLLYHTAMATATADALLRRPEPLVVDHHNITPPAFFDGWEPALAENLELAERQVARLARRAELGLGDSRFNVADLTRAGCRRTAVVPLITDAARTTRTPRARRAPGAGASSWLFVGRIAPNKAQHDVVRALACYRTLYDASAQLRLVGGAPFAGYATAVHRVAERLGVTDVVDWTGPVSDATLAAHYARADVYVCCSQHEGFGAPLLEAMASGVPVVALAATAVPETVGAAAFLVERADPELVAAAVHRVATDATLRDELVTAGYARVEALSPARAAAALVDALRPVLP